MKKILRFFLVLLLIACISIQLVRPEGNTQVEVAGNQLTASVPVDPEVQQILTHSCYDCHSNTTVYPWYWKLQPAAWFLDGHIQKGKKHLNFSEFSTYLAWKRYKKLGEISKEVREGDMPLYSYTLLHRDSRLSDDQRLKIENWATASMKEMEKRYPADSLKRMDR